jgi:carbon-monoxide dehydrogenase catalytic subunit
MCCKLCGMGPCRLTKDGQTGVCGATIDTIQARNLIRAIAAGGRPFRPRSRYGFHPQGRRQRGDRGLRHPRRGQAAQSGPLLRHSHRGAHPQEIANDLADLYIAQFGQQQGEVILIKRAPQKRQKLWQERGVVPRGIDREVVEALHRTTSAMTRTPSTFCNTPSAAPWPMVGAAA